jgi:hypothetical protein
MLTDLTSGKIAHHARELPEPSPFSHEILNANPYAFLDDAPLEERRARAVSVRRGLPAEVVERVGGFDAEAVRLVVEEAEPGPRTPTSCTTSCWTRARCPRTRACPRLERPVRDADRRRAGRAPGR